MSKRNIILTNLVIAFRISFILHKYRNGLSEDDKNTNTTDKSSNDAVRESYSLPNVSESTKIIPMGV